MYVLEIVFFLLPFVQKCTFYFGHYVVGSSISGFWLPLWYLQTLLPWRELCIIIFQHNKQVYFRRDCICSAELFHFPFLCSLLPFATERKIIRENKHVNKYNYYAKLIKKNTTLSEQSRMKTLDINIHDRSLSWLGRGISIKKKQ